MEWANMLRIANEAGGNIGSVFIICLTFFKSLELCSLIILGVSFIKFIKTMSESYTKRN